MTYQYPQQGYNPQQRGGYVQQQGGYVQQQQGGYVQQQQLQQQQLMQQQQRRPPPPQQQQPPSQQPQYNYSVVQMTTQTVVKEQVETKTSNNTPREWTFGFFDCFADLGLCNYSFIHVLNLFFF
jgi:hypothetical protein